MLSKVRVASFTRVILNNDVDNDEARLHRHKHNVFFYHYIRTGIMFSLATEQTKRPKKFTKSLKINTRDTIKSIISPKEEKETG